MKDRLIDVLKKYYSKRVNDYDYDYQTESSNWRDKIRINDFFMDFFDFLGFVAPKNCEWCPNENFMGLGEYYTDKTKTKHRPALAIGYNTGKLIKEEKYGKIYDVAEYISRKLYFPEDKELWFKEHFKDYKLHPAPFAEYLAVHWNSEEIFLNGNKFEDNLRDIVFDCTYSIIQEDPNLLAGLEKYLDYLESKYVIYGFYYGTDIPEELYVYTNKEQRDKDLEKKVSEKKYFSDITSFNRLIDSIPPILYGHFSEYCEMYGEWEVIDLQLFDSVKKCNESFESKEKDYEDNYDYSDQPRIKQFTVELKGGLPKIISQEPQQKQHLTKDIRRIEEIKDEIQRLERNIESSYRSLDKLEEELKQLENK